MDPVSKTYKYNPLPLDTAIDRVSPIPQHTLVVPPSTALVAVAGYKISAFLWALSHLTPRHIKKNNRQKRKEEQLEAAAQFEIDRAKKKAQETTTFLKKQRETIEKNRLERERAIVKQ